MRHDTEGFWRMVRTVLHKERGEGRVHGFDFLKAEVLVMWPKSAPIWISMRDVVPSLEHTF